MSGLGANSDTPSVERVQSRHDELVRSELGGRRARPKEERENTLGVRLSNVYQGGLLSTPTEEVVDDVFEEVGLA